MNVVIPNSVTAISDLAFSGCCSLTSLMIPSSVSNIYGDPFSGCTALTKITVESENTAFDSRNNCNAIIETASNTLILGCQSTVIPNSVTSIGDGAFSGCYGLTSITIPNSVTSIGRWAFSGCSGLTNLTIPNSVTTIGELAFSGCIGLTSVPRYVTSIGSDAFEGTAWYNNQPDGLVYAGLVAYKYKGTMPDGTSIIIKDGTHCIAGHAFFGCVGLTSVSIPNSVTIIGSEALTCCDGLKDVYSHITNLSIIEIENVFFDVWVFDESPFDYSFRTLHVLPGMVNAYQTDKNWYPYFGQIVEMALNGDVNLDGILSIADVSDAIDYVLGFNVTPFYVPNADLNGNGRVDLGDIVSIIDMLLQK